MLRKLSFLKSFLIVSIGLVSTYSNAQNANVQIVHNSPGAPAVDVWINGSTVVSGVVYRSATPFLSVPATPTTTVQIAVSGSNPYTIVSTDVLTLSSGFSYRAIASGVVGNTTPGAGFKVFFSAASTVTVSGNTVLDIVHSSPDAPSVGVVARGVATLVSSFSYGDSPVSLGVPSASYTLDVNALNASGSTVASYTADLRSFPNKNIAVIASGLLNSTATSFGLIAVDVQGNVVILPTAVEDAKVQIIHNSPGAPAVDVWINGSTVVSGLGYREALPFVAVPATSTTTVQIAVSNSNPYTIVSTDIITLTSNLSYRAIASGVVGSTTPGQAFKVFYSAANTATTSGNTGLDIIHSSPNAPAVGVVARGVTTLVSSFSFGDAPVFVSVPSNSYTIDINASDATGSRVTAFSAPLGSFPNSSIAVIASGLLGSSTTPFRLIAVDDQGNVVALSEITATSLAPSMPNEYASFNVYPNPASETVSIRSEAFKSARLLSSNGLEVLLSNSNTLNISSLDNGVYWVEVQDQGGNIKRSRLVIIR